MGRCKLCYQDRPLHNSHIIPEFFYTYAYDGKHRLHELSRDTGTMDFRQKGIREPLLCGDCEQLLNERYEDYVKEAWYDRGKLPRVPTRAPHNIEGLDYRRFKLCLLSILWRASVSRQEFFENVSLGVRHEEALRQMISKDDPGDETLYPFVCGVLWLPDAKSGAPYVVRDPAMAPTPKRYNHKYVYRFMFGGCSWDFLVGTDADFGKLSIKRSGTLSIGWLALHRLPEMRQFLADYERARRRRAS